MNNIITLFFSASAIAVVMAATAAHAETGTTREQVRAELVAAEKSGDIYFGDQGKTLREMYPERYSQATTTDSAQVSTAQSGGKTRAQVEAEVAAAERAGELSFGQEGLTQRELHPTWYPESNAASAVASTGGANPANYTCFKSILKESS
jgi:hypothetical protein